MAEAVVQRVEAIATRLEAHFAGKSSGGGDEKESAVVAAYQEYYDQYVVPFLTTCAHFDALKTIASQAETSFLFVKNVIEAQTKCKKPEQAALIQYIDPIVKAVAAAQNTDNRSPFFNHQKAWSETIQLHNWLLVPGPASHVESTLEASEFYLNKILALAKDANDADKKAHRDFVSQTKALINNLVPYIKENFKLGLNWSAKGVNLSEFASGGAAAPEASGGAPPPPPPPVDPNVSISTEAPASAGDAKKPGGMAAVFSSLNQGTAITSGLKKVTADMKTKNMKDVPALEVKSSAPAAKPAPQKVADVKKAAKLELRQGTWFCENFENTEVEIKEGQMKQNVYIYNCNGAVIKIGDKVKSVQVDKCTKTGVVFHSVVSTFEVVNSKRVTVQIVDNCPSLNIDKTSGIQLILTETSVKAPPQIITSNVTELNLVVPGPAADSDPVELPLPEQFLTVFENGKLTTTPIKHSGN